MSAARSMSGFDRHAVREVVRIGTLGAAVGLYLCLVGIVPIFNERPLIAGVLSLGQGAVLFTLFGAGYAATLRVGQAGYGPAVAAGAGAGIVSGASLALLVLAGAVLDLRAVFLHASDATYDLLTLGLGTAGFLVPLVVGGVAGAVAGILVHTPSGIRRPLSWALLMLVVLGLFAGVLRTPMLNNFLADAARFMFAPEGLTRIGAVLVFVLAMAIVVGVRRFAVRERVAALPAARRQQLRIPLLVLAIAIVLAFPIGFGSFFAQVIAIVAIYLLMGFGLNITLGLAGLLDLGFVAFFAVGAYTVGLLTSTGEFGLAGWAWWAAIPLAVVFAMAFGAFLGLPILGIRGDYLAIATLGFGEIIRILSSSDLLKPWLGGPQGILNIPKPIDVPPDHFLAGPHQIYYIALAGAAIIAFVAVRLRASRLGRSWMAIREDEDVAEALGMNLVQTKLLAYMLGAAFAGLGGGVFAGLVGAMFGSSITLFVSINVVALLIVGGMGSNPGVVVGAIFLIGLPELFREFSEYRFLLYGVALIAMMIYRPEGLLPSRTTRRELHRPEELETTAVDAAVTEEQADSVAASVVR
jgi:branched-chain amino acid transport system permease protein